MKKLLKCLLLIFFMLACFFETQVPAADSGSRLDQKTEILVLLDNSGSINGELVNSQREWAQEIAVLSQGADVILNYLLFDNQRDETVKAPDDSYKERMFSANEILNNINGIIEWNHKGKLTDFREALQDAKSYLDGSEAQNKYIVMISDGNMDLVDDELETKSDNGDQEAYKRVEIQKQQQKEAEEQFYTMAKEFVNEKNRAIILVNLREDEEEEISVFENLDKEENITYCNKDNALDDAMREIFETLNIPIEVQTKQDTQKNIQFFVNKDTYRVIIKIKYRSGLQNFQEPNISYDSYIAQEDIEEQPISDNLIFIYMRNRGEGDVTISLPEGDYEYKIINQQFLRLTKLELLIMQDKIECKYNNLSEYGTEMKEYTVKGGEFDLRLDMKDESNENSVLNFQTAYLLKEFSNDSDLESIIMNNEQQMGDLYTICKFKKPEGLINSAICTVRNQKAGNYVCIVRINSGGVLYYSNPVIILLEDVDDTKHEINIEANREYKWRTYIPELLEDVLSIEITNQDGKIENGVLEEVDNEIGDGWCRISKENFTFLQQGLYTIVFYDKNSKQLKQLEFAVEAEKESETMKEETPKKLYSIIGLLIVVSVVIGVGVIYYQRKVNKG